MAEPTIAQNPKARNDLTAAYVRAILDYDPATGEFRWRRRADQRPQWNARYAGTVAGNVGNHGYRQIGVNGRVYLAHRLAWLIETGAWPNEQIDHENLVKDDNLFVNLREATDSENKYNTHLRADNTSGVKGVCWHKALGKWRGRIWHNGQLHYLGGFDTLADAAEAVAMKRAELHGSFARE